jgi:hypothetical protein
VAHFDVSAPGGTIARVSALEFVASLISSLVWPAVVVTFVLVFRTQLKTVLQKLADRLKKVSGGGFEAEFGDLKQLEANAALAGLPIYGGTVPQGVGQSGEADLQIRDKTEAEAEGEVERATERKGGEFVEYVRLDPEVRSLLVKAKTIVDREPREAVLIAGRALERSITSTLHSLDIPYGQDPRPVGPIRALQDAQVVGDIQAEMLGQLYQLYRSATRDSAEEITGLSALQYISRVEKEVASLALRQRELSRSKADRTPN